jgi:EmrB/QacA subfamily drug resistance transporter
MSTSSDTPDQPFSLKTVIGPLIAIVLGMIMIILDSTIINIALNKLQQEFHSTLSIIQWTVTGYTLALAAVIPLAGWMIDKFGSKRIFLLSILLFTISSVLCGTAQTIDQLIIYRVIQGVGGGMVVPIGMAMIFRLAPPEKRGTVMGFLGVPMLMAPLMGPSLAGGLIQYVSWQWIFWINIPIGIIAILVGMKYLPTYERNKVPTLDLWGMILGPIAFSMLAFSVSEGGRVGWGSVYSLGSLIIGAVALLIFIINELRHKHPLLELRVFRSSKFTSGILLMWFSQACLFGVMILVPLFLQTVKHFTPLQTGLSVIPQAVAAMIFMTIGGQLFDKYGARPLALVGFTVVAGAMFMLSQIDLHTSVYMILLSLFMVGTGMGLTVVTLETHVLNSAPSELVNRVTPLTTATLQVVTSFAVAGLTGFHTLRTKMYLEDAGQSSPSLASTVSAFDDTFLLLMVLAIVGLVISFMLRKPSSQANESNPTTTQSIST